ncbi:BA75_03678T0 [Komagataella pastoris]|uniref:Protein arginine methyltransferase NDUFAF7 n=1 Tax=Komagataella pastoris TaxID=4922 RepID=A0A1B2JEW0_PICPA|nr:BA75_03678T0 [Komagataella pastoris]
MKKFLHDYTVNPNTFSFRLGKQPYEGSFMRQVLKASGHDAWNERENQQLFIKHPTTTFNRQSRNPKRPKGVKMLASDFIEDSLYNRHYGYFSKQVEIFQPSTPFEYAKMESQDQFMRDWQSQYTRYEDKKASSDQKSPKEQKTNAKDIQLWHTPTELFQPYYGEALARYLLVNYMLNQFPYDDLVIYEMGGGNGTLMLNILNYIREKQPDVYERTQYRIIEISHNLSTKQEETALQLKAKDHDHHGKVQIINKSIFDWKEVEPNPCFFIALEVFDNFAHDVIRYDNTTREPYQGYVVVDEHGDFKEFFTRDLDDWANAFLGLRENGKYPRLNQKSLWGDHPLAKNAFYRGFKDSIYPVHANLSDPEYIPTRLLKFFHILKYKFPQHQLLASDFSKLNETIPGYMAPVVQTMLNNRMVTTDSYMVLQGYFDIMFPTDFQLASDLYRQVVGKLADVSSHREFLSQWADIRATTTQTGENPMLEFYKNADFMYS